MILDRVTVTGADDSIDPTELILLSKRYPYVEWGILLSRSQEGSPRFPSLGWMQQLDRVRHTFADMVPLQLSGHLCGSWVRSLCQGGRHFQAERPNIASMFQRVQLNFHASPHGTDESLFVDVLRMWRRQEYIFQFDAVNNFLMGVVSAAGIRAVPLFDTSGGAGVEPSEWPAPIGDYCGYAGGLHPDKLALQLERIANAAGPSRIWIDVETHVRSDNDCQFDLAKVEQFLAIAEPWVTPAERTACEMVEHSHGGNGQGEEFPCTTASIGMTEDGTRVCERHGRAAALEDITVTWDKAP